MFADDQVLFAKPENGLPFSTQLLYNLEISSNKSKVMAFEGTKKIQNSKFIIIEGEPFLISGL
jgi:hypothetical protein